MISINLIPQDFLPVGKTALAVKLLKNLSVALFGIFLVSVASLLAVFIFYTVSIQKAQAAENQVKNSVKALSETEQQLLLTQDRLSYAKTILGKETTIPEAEKLQVLTSGSLGVSLVQGQITPFKNDLNFSAGNLNGLKDFLAKFKSGAIYPNALLSSFNYNPESGYQINIVTLQKSI